MFGCRVASKATLRLAAKSQLTAVSFAADGALTATTTDID